MRRLPLAALESAAVSPIISPLATAMAVLGAVMAGGDQAGTPLRIRRALLAHLRRRDLAALRPLRLLARPDGAGGRPNAVVPVLRGASPAEELEAVRAVDPGAVATGIAAAAAAGVPVGAWESVARDPERWLADYAGALHRAWPVLGPIWSRSAELLDREVERISVQLARGAAAELITRLLPCSAVVDDELLLPSHSPASGPVLVGQAVLLYPLLAPSYCSGWTDDDDGGVCLAVRYAIPRAWRAFAADQPAPASLAALIGQQRAKVLHSLDRGATAGELAELLHGVPSMVTYHLRALEAAGLITRTREGRNVWVRRSGRGTALVALYERDGGARTATVRSANARTAASR